MCAVLLCELLRKRVGKCSPCDVSFWCFPNQRSGTISDEDVMSSSGSLFHANCGHTSRAALLMLYPCLHFHLSWTVFFSEFVFFSLCLYLSFVILKGCRRLLAVFSLVFYEWDVLFTLTELFLSVLMMNTYSVTTLTSSCITLLPCDWLMLSHWQRLRVCKVDVNVCVCVCIYACGQEC